MANATCSRSHIEATVLRHLSGEGCVLSGTSHTTLNDATGALQTWYYSQNAIRKGKHQIELAFLLASFQQVTDKITSVFGEKEDDYSHESWPTCLDVRKANETNKDRFDATMQLVKKLESMNFVMLLTDLNKFLSRTDPSSDHVCQMLDQWVDVSPEVTSVYNDLRALLSGTDGSPEDMGSAKDDEADGATIDDENAHDRDHVMTDAERKWADTERAALHSAVVGTELGWLRLNVEFSKILEHLKEEEDRDDVPLAQLAEINKLRRNLRKLITTEDPDEMRRALNDVDTACLKWHAGTLLPSLADAVQECGLSSQQDGQLLLLLPPPPPSSK